MEAKLICLSAMLALGLARLEAQTNVYIALNANFQLTAVVQSSPHSVSNARVTSRDLVQAIGAATTNQFSPQAKLVVLFRVIGGVPFFVIRDGTNELNTAEFLTARQITDPIARLKNGPTGLVTGTVYCEEGFRLVNSGPLEFDVQGLNTAPQSNRGDGVLSLPHYGPTSLHIDVAGAGTVGGNPAVFRGTVLLTGRKLELRADGE